MLLHRRLLGLLLVALPVGCAAGDPIDPTGAGANGNDPDPQQNDEDAICLLHNCTEDAHCGACDEGRNTCLVEEGRCVACNAETNSGCFEGEECSSWGNCVPIGLDCPTDPHGDPTITCSSNGDCAACDPLHQVCDTSVGACVACTSTDTSACQSTDQCIGGQCEAECPSSCTMDADCSQCGGPGAPAHACNAHICSECSDSMPCAGGQECTAQGVCADRCGSDGSGACASDADCDGCGAGNDTCHKPINSSNGTCGPDAAGCSDLGGLALPSPWNQYTNTCSNDGDCDGVGATINIGEVLRDLTGIDDIGDANIEYGMNACAAITVADTSCGVCVPCREDADCAPIDIDDVAAQAFGPIGSLAADFLLDLAFGPNAHQVNMYCQQVGAGYGVCAPCPGLIYECGVGGPGGTNPGSGSCDHDACEIGSAMDPSCDSCAADLCAVDSYCCETEWDDVCVSEVAEACGTTCGEDPGDPEDPPVGNCHDECTAGEPQDPSCNACVDAICTQDSYCCDVEWDDVCIGYVDDLCSPPC